MCICSDSKNAATFSDTAFVITCTFLLVVVFDCRRVMEKVKCSAKKSVNRERRELEGILNKFNEGSVLIWVVFALTTTAPVFSGLHEYAYVFISEVPMHWCTVSELSQANWTDLQIRNVSSATSCTRYSYNYSYLSTLSFEEALAFAENHRDVETEKCTRYSYADGTEATSIAIKWDLVCDRTALRSNVQMSVALGRCIGSVFGVIADRFGRRVSYIIGVLLLNLCGPASAFVPWYWLFVVLRVLIGASITAICITTFTVLSEMVIPKYRNVMSVVQGVGYPLGLIILSGIAYGVRNWQLLQLTISLSALVLLLLYKFMPESPRWLLSQNRCADAKIIMKKLCGPHIFEVNGELKSTARFTESADESSEEVSIADETRVKQMHCLGKWNNYIDIFSNNELRNRLFIECLAWFTSFLTYHSIALSGNNFSADQYIYSFSTGLAEIPAILIVLPLLVVLGRRPASALLFFISGTALLCILIVPQSETPAIMGVALIGRSSIGAVLCVLFLQVSELFPTVVRNTALGTSVAMGYVGGFLGPFVVDLLGEKAWWAPSTLCGIAALITGALSLLLPETRNRPLAATVSEEVIYERGRTSIRNCCAFKSTYSSGLSGERTGQSRGASGLQGPRTTTRVEES